MFRRDTFMYLPGKSSTKPGELSGYREELEKRNGKIISEYRQGSSVEGLADRYSLSTSAIRKIIYQKKQKKNEESGRENENCGKQS